MLGRPRRRDAERHRRRAERLTRTLAELGPTFIKLAQVFAARADILPEPYLSRHRHAHRPGPAAAAGRGRAGGARGAGTRRGRACSSASSRSRSRPPRWARCTGPRIAGREVVVKVLRPGVEELVRRGSRRLLPHPVPAQPAVPQPSHARDHRDRERVLQAHPRRARLPGGGPERGDAAPELPERAARGRAGGGDRAGDAAGAGAGVRGGHADRPAARAPGLGRAGPAAAGRDRGRRLHQDDARGRRLPCRSARRQPAGRSAGPAGAARLRHGAPGRARDPAAAGRDGARRRAPGRGRRHQRLLRAGHSRPRRRSRHRARRRPEPHGRLAPGRDLAAADPAAGGAGAEHVLRVAADAAVQPGLLRAGGRARRGDRAPLRSRTSTRSRWPGRCSTAPRSG